MPVPWLADRQARAPWRRVREALRDATIGWSRRFPPNALGRRRPEYPTQACAVDNLTASRWTARRRARLPGSSDCGSPPLLASVKRWLRLVDRERAAPTALKRALGDAARTGVPSFDRSCLSVCGTEFFLRCSPHARYLASTSDDRVQ